MSYIRLSDYIPNYPTKEAALRACFADAVQDSQTVLLIEPGEYILEGLVPIPLPGDTHVIAHGAVFSFPVDLGDNTDRSMFRGENISDFSWEGGKFLGYVYNPDAKEHVWAPCTHTVCIEIYRKGQDIRNFRFTGMEAENVAGPVVHICGEKDEVTSFLAENVDVENCRFINCGLMMWDYGYLWQNIVFANETAPEKVQEAYRYMPEEVMSSSLTLEDGKLYADFMPQWNHDEKDSVTLFGDTLPEGIVRGKRYFVVNEGSENGLLLSETYGGEPVTLTSMPENTRLFRNMFYVYRLYFPIGNTSSQKGAIDTTLCRNVSITGCRFSAVGDSMHILECENAVFANNQILGARMGAFYIGFQCKNVTVTGNTVYGTNGSRIISVERESEDIVITGNTFTGGGRGSWFNQPKNIVISNNIFIHNTNKCTNDLKTGRICYATGEFERYSELYFTTWQDSGNAYGPVVISDNIIDSLPSADAAIALNPGGQDISIHNNIFRGSTGDIHVACGCEMPTFQNNIHQGEIIDRIFINPANVK